MFKFLTKSIVFSVVWRRYKTLIVSTVLLFLMYFVIALIHDDYVEYSLASQTENALGFAYIVKWAAMAIGTFVYYVINFPPAILRKNKSGKRLRDAEEEAVLGAACENFSENPLRDNDPFAGIRQKKQLNSRADACLKE
ncbi:hypothetical protein [Teredinibacter purpureus]|uniref:hypothetical protein n=1 Tax=Teredinibacter purpureus TaxID=2731756 RepID=UPI0005F76572|nr:hypothetical protein [Teredinibacter purpureus]